MVTAEPYGAVARPSPRIVAKNKVKDDDSIETIGGVTYQGDDGPQRNRRVEIIINDK